MGVMGEQLMFNKWKEFFQNLTLEWLLENCTGEGNFPLHYPTSVDTFTTSFSVYCGERLFHFKNPSGLLALLSSNDERLFEYLPEGVWGDFIRLVSL